MSIAVQTLDTVRVVDPRTDVNSAARRTYRILDGPQDAGYVKIAPQGTASPNMTFIVNPPSTRVFVNRHVLVETKFTLTFRGTSSEANQRLINAAGLRHNPANIASTLKCDGPRAYPLANATRSLQVTINNDRITQPINRYWRAMARYSNSFDQQNLDQSTTPTFLDQTQTYAEAGTGSGARAPLGDYTDNLEVCPRGGWTDCVVTANPMSAAAGNALVATVELTCAEPLWLSPFLYQRHNQSTGLIGVANMTLQLDLGGRSAGGLGGLAAALWSHQASFIVGGDEQICPLTSCEAVVTDAFVHAAFLTPDMLQQIPLVNSYPYYEPQVYSPAPTTLASGARTTLTMNTVQLNSVPSRMYIFASRSDASVTINDTDCFARIDGVNLSFDNRDSILSNASSYDLYQIAVKNGVNMSWPQWSKHTGSVLALDFGEDVPLRANQAPGLRGSYNLQLRVDVTNTSSANIDYQLTVVVVSVGVLTISHQNVVRSVGVLTTDDILASKQQDALPWSPSGDIYGGGIWDDVKGFFKKAMGFLKPLAAKAAMAAPIVAPEFAPYATGASSILNAIGDMTGTGMTGGGLVGGALVGGKKISRKQLQKMLK